ncbi:Uncharacterised protein [[Clostridium] sordellii]|uniref:hypothetical protein n=1 Tax=Paraclostridium sordellii TaxID=1505 RepID=UPI0005E0448E|nr:hypothetical protein [Paeniclostridium sordellii]CEO11988.1 Uncharacterised protein [[Clostridium] sordellii] [Paeniclostridium sordellii]
MKSQFSEFTYGFSVTNELLYYFRDNTSQAPIFPSLLEEGRDGGGYDMKINYDGIPIFLQFKLSEFMYSKNAKELDLFNNPYYRFSLMPSKYSNQHKMLIDLESSGEMVYYSAPKFHTIEELNNYFSNNTIVDNSIFISPTEIGQLPDDDEHRIVFDVNTTSIYRCSTPKKIYTGVGYSLIDKVKTYKSKTINDKFLISLAKRMDGIIRDNMKGNEAILVYQGLKHKNIEVNENPIKYIEYLSTNFFGCIFTIL